MKSILLLAKYYAHLEKSINIELNHLRKALTNVTITNDKAKEIIFKELNVESNHAQYLVEDYTLIAKNLPIINYSEEVNLLKIRLEQENINLDTIVSNLIFKKVSKSNEFVRIKDLKNSLNKKVFSQELAIETICDKLTETVYLKNDKAPKAILFFLGPPATGKTYITEVISENLEDYNYMVYDMSNYSDGGQGFALFGLTKGYKQATEGKLTRFVKEHPKSIIVFDEVEKAHPDVLQSFLPLLSQAKVRDEFTEEIINFNETILIFTSNLGSELYSNKHFIEKIKKDKEDAQTMLLDVVSREKKTINGREFNVLSPEFLSRISQGDLVLFNKLSFDSYLKIAEEVLDKSINSFTDNLELKLLYPSLKNLSTIFLLTFLPDFDARRIKSKISIKLLDLITDKIRDDELVDINKIEIKFDKDVENFIEEFNLKSSEEKDNFINECFRKNNAYKFFIDDEFDLDNNLILTIKNLKKIRIEKSKDFQGDGKINLEVPTISFSDIVGHKKAKEDLTQIKELLINPDKLNSYKIDIPKGMLLYGIPGTGKTMFAKAFANETDLPFIATTGSEILDINFMKKIFKRAREYAPSIIFIDEIDAIGRRNGGNIDIIINHFLTELNGFTDTEDNIFVIAATNLKEKIDPAILRSGRIDQHIEIGNLDKDARGFFIDKILKNNKVIKYNKDKLITYTSGMTGADLEKVNRECALYLIKHKLEELDEYTLLEIINIIKYGERLSGTFIKELTDATAYHEAGHAVVSKILFPKTKIEQITIVPRNNSLGFVSYNNEDNISNLTKNDIMNKICVLFAGRLSQMKMYKDEAFDSGASSDLSQATYYAYLAISKFGMGENIGYLSIDKLKENEISDVLKNKILEEVKSWLEEAKTKTIELINNNWVKIERVAITLIEKESIEEQELNNIIK